MKFNPANIRRGFTIQSRGSKALVFATVMMLGVPALHVTSQAASKSKVAPTRRLEVWPGQRVLVVLPLTAGEGWTQNGDLTKALIPVIQPQLQKALESTNKFSVTLPYKFDPILRRAVTEKILTDVDVTKFVDSPSIDSVTPIVGGLNFEQPAMVAQVTLEDLVVGGTPDAPTVQLKVLGRLYDKQMGAAFRTATVTSKPFGGKTPEERLTSAAADAFYELAQALVAPPQSFTLPSPLGTTAPVPTTETPIVPVPTTTTPATPVPVPNPPTITPPSQVSPPVVNNGAGNVPVLPPAQPPLGVNVPEGN